VLESSHFPVARSVGAAVDVNIFTCSIQLGNVLLDDK
jgi:hypothetical protein